MGRVGVLLASTKGFIEDVIWSRNQTLPADTISLS